MSRTTMRSTGPVITPILSASRMHQPFPQSWSRNRSAELMLKNSLPSRILGIQSGSSDEVKTSSATSLIAGSSSARSRRLTRRSSCQIHGQSIQPPMSSLGTCTYRHRSGAEYISIRIGDMFAALSCCGHPVNSESSGYIRECCRTRATLRSGRCTSRSVALRNVKTALHLGCEQRPPNVSDFGRDLLRFVAEARHMARIERRWVGWARARCPGRPRDRGRDMARGHPVVVGRWPKVRGPRGCHPDPESARALPWLVRRSEGVARLEVPHRLRDRVACLTHRPHPGVHPRGWTVGRCDRRRPSAEIHPQTH